MSEVENEGLDIGKYLKALRKQKGMTLIQLQKLSGVSNSYLSQIENGQFTPSGEILKKLADSLDVSYLKLMYIAGHIPQELYLESKQLEDSITSKEKIMLEQHRQIGRIKDEIDRLESEYVALEAITTDSVYDEDNHDLLERLKNTINFKRKHYIDLIHKLQQNHIEVENLSNRLYDIRKLIEEKEKTTDEAEERRIQKEIDLQTEDLLETLITTSGINNIDITLSVPVQIIEKDANGVTISRIAENEEEVKSWLFDLHFLLKMELDLHYKGKKLSDEDKEKIKTMLEMILE